jgi:hypothetical protein
MPKPASEFDKTYVVADRGMGDVRMIATADREWFAHDPITPDDIDAESFAEFLRDGVIEEVE